MTIKPCNSCGRKFEANNGAHIRCRACCAINNRASARARAMVARAIATGLLPSLKNSSVPCVDCGAQAVHHDHRDYGRPLDVQPVCHSCNLLRGPARLPVAELINAIVGVVA